MWLCSRGPPLARISRRGLWQAGGEAGRQAVQPSGGKEACGADRSHALTHAQMHAFRTALKHSHIVTRGDKPTCFVDLLYGNLSP